MNIAGTAQRGACERDEQRPSPTQPWRRRVSFDHSFKSVPSGSSTTDRTRTGSPNREPSCAVTLPQLTVGATAAKLGIQG